MDSWQMSVALHECSALLNEAWTIAVRQPMLNEVRKGAIVFDQIVCMVMFLYLFLLILNLEWIL